MLKIYKQAKTYKTDLYKCVFIDLDSVLVEIQAYFLVFIYLYDNNLYTKKIGNTIGNTKDLTMVSRIG